MGARWLMLVLLAALGQLGVAEDGTGKDPYKCAGIPTSGRILPSNDIVLRAGETLRLWCELKPGRGSRSEDLGFSVDNKFVDASYLERNATTLQLVIPNVNISTANYFCKLKNNTICNAIVAVDVPPMKVEDLDCISYNWRNLTCTWSEPNRRKQIDVNYTLCYTVIARAARKVMCAQIEHDADYKNYKGTWRGDDYLPASRNYAIVLYSKSLFGNNSLEMKVDQLSLVKPNPPKDFEVYESIPYGFKMRWKISSVLLAYPDGLIYRISYLTEDYDAGHWTNIDLELPGRDMDVNREYELTGLKYANTRYDIRLYIKVKPSADLWSDFVSSVNRTVAQRPDRPPTVHSSSFEVIPTRDGRQVYVFLQRIENYEEKGNKFGYGIVEISTPSGLLSRNFKFESNAYIFIDNFPEERTTLSIVSSNEMGRSSNRSEIVIPAQTELLKEPENFMKIDYGNRLFQLSWNPVDGDRVRQYTLFWCQNKLDRPYPCNGKLDWLTVSKDEKSFNLTMPDDESYQFAISADGDDTSSGMVWAKCTIISDRPASKMKNVWINRVGSTYIEVAWKLVCSDQVGIVAGYRVIYCAVPSVRNTTCISDIKSHVVNGSVSSSYNISDLTPHTTYGINITVITSTFGDGIPSDPMYNLTSEGEPTEPRNVSVKFLPNNGVRVFWTRPEKSNGFIKEYEVFYTTDDARADTVDSPRPVTLDSPRPVALDGAEKGTAKLNGNEQYLELILPNLLSFTNYTVQVRACTVLCSKFSPQIKFRTPVGFPGPVEDVSLSRALFQESTRVLTWKAPKRPGGPIDYYEIKIVEMTSDYNNTYNFTSTTNSLNVTLSLCKDPKILNNLFFVRGVNVDRYADHGALALYNLKSVDFDNADVRSAIRDHKPFNFSGAWSKEQNSDCTRSGESGGSAALNIMVIVIVSLIAVLVIYYCVRRAYMYLQQMRNIKPRMPPGLDPHILGLEKEMKLNSGKWPNHGKDTDKSAKMASDAESLLHSKRSPNSESKKSDLCDNSNCSVDTESTGFSYTRPGNMLNARQCNPQEIEREPLSADSSLRLRNVKPESLSDPFMMHDDRLRPKSDIGPYSAVGLDNDFDMTDRKPYVAFGALPNVNAPPTIDPSRWNFNKEFADISPIPDGMESPPANLPSGYVVAGIPEKPFTTPRNYVKLDHLMNGQPNNGPAEVDKLDTKKPYVSLPEIKRFDKPVIKPNSSYVKNGDLQTDNLELSTMPKFPAVVLKQTDMSDNPLVENGDALSPTYCKFGVDTNSPQPFNFHVGDVQNNYMSDFADIGDGDKDMFLIEPRAPNGSTVSSHYVPHNPNVNRL